MQFPKSNKYVVVEVLYNIIFDLNLLPSLSWWHKSPRKRGLNLVSYWII